MILDDIKEIGTKVYTVQDYTELRNQLESMCVELKEMGTSNMLERKTADVVAELAQLIVMTLNQLPPAGDYVKVEA